MEKGTVLFTKDGRKIGNAIVLGSKVLSYSGNKTMWFVQFVKIKTDFGNVVKLTDGEIDDLFWTPYNTEDFVVRNQTIFGWMLAKLKLFFKF